MPISQEIIDKYISLTPIQKIALNIAIEDLGIPLILKKYWI